MYGKAAAIDSYPGCVCMTALLLSHFKKPTQLLSSSAARNKTLCPRTCYIYFDLLFREYLVRERSREVL